MTMLATPTKRLAPAGGIGCESDSIETVPLTEERSFAYWQQDIPQSYWSKTAAELTERIAAARAKLGTRLVVLGHHYQREDIIQFADFRGDSFKLSQWAAERPKAEYIVFCGVHFMAEAADILSAPPRMFRRSRCSQLPRSALPPPAASAARAPPSRRCR